MSRPALAERVTRCWCDCYRCDVALNRQQHVVDLVDCCATIFELIGILVGEFKQLATVTNQGSAYN